MKISHLIFASIFFILLLFSITTYINYKQSEEVRKNGNYLSISSNIVRQSNQFQRNILYMERSLRGYLLSRQSYFLETYNFASHQNSLLLKELFNLIPSNSPQYFNLVEIQKLYNQWLIQFSEPVSRVKSNSKKPDNNLTSGNQYYEYGKAIREEESLNENLQQKFRELLNHEYSNRKKRKSILEKSERNTKVISISLTAFSIVTGFAIALFLARHISTRILKMVSMANNIGKGNYNVYVNDTAKDELSKLTNSLNQMANILSENFSLLQRKNKELDQFAYIVSHDLKAPLRGIDNLISWMQEDYKKSFPTEVQEYFQLIKGRINRSENLIQGILTYARVGKEVQDKEKFNVTSLVKDVVENLGINNIKRVNIQKDMPIIYSEKLPLSQIFSNLISNAAKYHDKPNGEIKVYSKEKEDCYEFFVEDNGPGIAKTYHEKIFVIFQTLKERDSFESTGVGLAIVKKIIDDRNEKIKIISEPGRGSIFTFTWSKQ